METVSTRPMVTVTLLIHMSCMVLKMVANGRLPAEKMGTHTFRFDEIDNAYDVFENAAANLALKVVITP